MSLDQPNDELLSEVRRLRALVAQHAEELAALRAEAQRLRAERGGVARLPRLTQEEMSFAREMGMGLRSSRAS